MRAGGPEQRSRRGRVIGREPIAGQEKRPPSTALQGVPARAFNGPSLGSRRLATLASLAPGNRMKHDQINFVFRPGGSASLADLFRRHSVAEISASSRTDARTPTRSSNRLALGDNRPIERAVPHKSDAGSNVFKRIGHVEIVTDQLDRTVKVLHTNVGLHGESLKWTERAVLGPLTL